ncbi:hypothetical protein B9Z55_020504 [Caenorhabditis nigoni]|uniref:DZF domain-containing protein n=1 Tax=Caenorhabditis nigoni TaxID=1611254 RepID=A0A2G5TMZ0_9PELO|nr:hypothetical protein B9Z55_020504 [Caenorhabditis nigoni]
MVAKRPNFRRGAPRGYRQHQIVEAPVSYAPIPRQVRTVYDITLAKGNLEGGVKNNMDVVFDKEIMDRAKNLTPPAEIRERIADYGRKVIAALEKEKSENTLPDISVAEIIPVGSFMNDTITHSSDKSDIVVQLNGLPSFENVSDLGRRIVDNMKMADPKETGEPLPQDYGFLISSHNCKVRVLVTIIPGDSAKLEPELHLDEKILMINYFSTRHTSWFAAQANSLSEENVQEYRALIRVLKDTRSRYSDFQHLSIWSLQYLAHYCLFKGPSRQKVNLGTAFRRFFELIAAGIFLPKAASLVDETAPNHCIGFDLTFQQRDSICQGAQTLVRIFATGNDGYRTILGTHGTAADLTQTASTWKGIEIRPALDAYKPGCME